MLLELKKFFIIVVAISITNWLHCKNIVYRPKPTVYIGPIEKSKLYDISNYYITYKEGLYVKKLALTDLFPEHSMFWDYYEDSYDFVQKYYYDDLYKTTLPLNITIRVNLREYVKDSHFMTFSMPIDIETNKYIKKSMMFLRDIFSPNFRSSKSRLRGENE